jgi:hypothetical protein
MTSDLRLNDIYDRQITAELFILKYERSTKTSLN